MKQLLGIKQCTWDELRVTCGRVALYWTPETNTTLCLHSLEFKLKDNIRLMTPTYQVFCSFQSLPYVGKITMKFFKSMYDVGDSLCPYLGLWFQQDSESGSQLILLDGPETSISCFHVLTECSSRSSEFLSGFLPRNQPESGTNHPRHL